MSAIADGTRTYHSGVVFGGGGGGRRVAVGGRFCLGRDADALVRTLAWKKEAGDAYAFRSCLRAVVRPRHPSDG